MRVAEIMQAKVEAIGPREAAESAWEVMQVRRIRHLVVVHEGQLVGVVSDRDLGGRAGGNLRQGLLVRDVMSANVTSAGPETTVREAANLMRGRTIGCLPVLDGDHVVGIITRSDLLELIGRGLQRPVAQTRRWTLKRRAPRPKLHGRAPGAAGTP